MDSVQQVSRDWLAQPFVDITVTTNDYCPSSHPDLVYNRPFLGTTVGCDCFGIKDRWIYGGGDSFSNFACGRNETREGCRMSKPIHPIIMGQVEGERICGKRADYSWLTAVRLVKTPERGIRCPDGYVHCGVHNPDLMPIS